MEFEQSFGRRGHKKLTLRSYKARNRGSVSAMIPSALHKNERCGMLTDIYDLPMIMVAPYKYFVSSNL